MMTSQLQSLRSELAALGRQRAQARLLTGWSVVGEVLLWSLVGIFAIDWGFQRTVQPPQRIALMVLGGLAVIYSFRNWAWPLLRISESETEMALLVERQQQIDSDLVAALQFERDEQGRLGSRQLEMAVVGYVADLGRDLDVFEGLDRSLMNQRIVRFLMVLLLCLVGGIIFPGHLRAFLERLALQPAHYPTVTRIEQLAVSGRPLELRGMQPTDIRLPEGEKLEFLVSCRGQLPTNGTAALLSAHSAQLHSLDLKPLPPEERSARLQASLKRIEAARQDADLDLAGNWLDELPDLLPLVLPEAWSTFSGGLREATARERNELVRRRLPALEEALRAVIANSANAGEIYVGAIPRFIEPVRYELTLGDAFTDPARVDLIPLPLVEAVVKPVPPRYAAKILNAATVGRQSAVLAGSEVHVELQSVNNKPLREAWITLRGAEGPAERINLQATDDARTKWRLPLAGTPLAKVAQELQYEFQVTDDDSLHLPAPLKGTIRLRRDLPPVVAISSIHKVVLPQGKPKIQVRASDDFGLKRIALEIQVERGAALAAKGSEASLAEEQAPASREVSTLELLKASIPAENMPHLERFAVPLSRLTLQPELGALKKGDRLVITPLAEDDRGDADGEIFRGDSIAWDVTDELGIAGAVSEADPLTEERMNDLIQRQLGIGESP